MAQTGTRKSRYGMVTQTESTWDDMTQTWDEATQTWVDYHTGDPSFTTTSVSKKTRN
jgi:hypothetical protein